MAKRRVMIIDDEEDFLWMTKVNLEKTGKFEVRALKDAKDIINNLHTFNPDVILLDLLMPSVDGLEACEMLNKDPVGIKTPIIIVSAIGKYKDQLKMYKVGIVDYIVKPVEKRVLIAKIEKALQFK